LTVPRPNILLITTDQHRGDCFGFAGRRVSTPHLDLLASQATRFSACIAASPVCMPARASILTGLLPLTHGTADNGIDLDEQVGEAGFAGSLARSGYQTAFIGKAHFSSNHSQAPTGRCENLPSSHLFADAWHGPYMGFQHVELMQLGHNYWLPDAPPGGMHYERWYHADGAGALKNELYRKRLAPHTSAAQTHNSALPEAWHNTAWVGDRSIEYLRDQGRRRRAGDGRPFCAWLSFADPHHPFDAPAPWCWMHRPEDVDLPPHRTLDVERRPWWHRAAIENEPQGPSKKVRQEYSRMDPQSDEQLREIIANYYGMISLVDHNVGRILSVLREEGFADDTFVVFTSDHGDWLGDHGLVLKGPMLYDGLLRVALIVQGPGIAQGRVIDAPVSSVDLAASFGEWANSEVSSALHGRSLGRLLRGEEDGREHVFAEWRLGSARCGVALDLRCVRTRDAKLTMELGSGAGELYDLRNDPSECTNRFEDAAYAGLRDEMLDRLAQRPQDVVEVLRAPSGPG
jgi:arylsulfatase A-like enzyme